MYLGSTHNLNMYFAFFQSVSCHFILLMAYFAGQVYNFNKFQLSNFSLMNYDFNMKYIISSPTPDHIDFSPKFSRNDIVLCFTIRSSTHFELILWHTRSTSRLTCVYVNYPFDSASFFEKTSFFFSLNCLCFCKILVNWICIG